MTGSSTVDAEVAFGRAARGPLRDTLRRWRRTQLPVIDERRVRRGHRVLVRSVALDDIRGTLEPSRARLFDACFRPRRSVRQRWQRLWLVEQRGQPLPPVSLAWVGDGYAIRDGHHRVSVAKARGALEIDAAVEI